MTAERYQRALEMMVQSASNLYSVPEERIHIRIHGLGGGPFRLFGFTRSSFAGEDVVFLRGVFLMEGGQRIVLVTPDRLDSLDAVVELALEPGKKIGFSFVTE